MVMPDRDDETFLGRWSRRKQQARTGRPGSDEPVLRHEADAGAPAVPAAEPGQAPTDMPAADDPSRMLTEADFADVDFGLLNAGSDYKRFMAPNVPDSIRNRALAKLWTSDPQFAGLDPWHDYHVDFTDAARAVPTGLATAYKVGRGFLSDEEVAAWDNLGKPAPDTGKPETAKAEQPPDASALAMSPADTQVAADAGQTRPDPAAPPPVVAAAPMGDAGGTPLSGIDVAKAAPEAKSGKMDRNGAC